MVKLEAAASGLSQCFSEAIAPVESTIWVSGYQGRCGSGDHKCLAQYSSLIVISFGGATLATVTSSMSAHRATIRCRQSQIYGIVRISVRCRQRCMAVVPSPDQVSRDRPMGRSQAWIAHRTLKEISWPSSADWSRPHRRTECR
jgi:hypothetical protein